MLSLEATVIKANLWCVLLQPEALKRAWQRAPTDFTAHLRATEAYFKKRRLSCDLKFILDYGLLRISTTNRVPSQLETTSRRDIFHSREKSYECNYVFPDVSVPSASCGAYYWRESLDARQMIRNNTHYYSRPTRRPTFAMW